MERLSINRFEQNLLFLVGATFPLLNLRIDLGFYTATAYLLMLNVLITYTLLLKPRFQEITFNGLDMVVLLFLSSYLFSIIYSVNQSLALSNFIKLIIVIILYFLFKNALSIYPHYLRIIINNALKSLPIYLLYLAYRYLYVFKASYIGLNTEFMTGSGKNSLAFMLAILIPFIITDLFSYKDKKSIIKFTSYVIVFIVAILIQSRGLYLIIIINFLSFILLSKNKSKYIFKMIIVLIACLIILLILIPDSIKSASLDRISELSIIFSRESDLSELSNPRSQLLNRGLMLFIKNPIFGVGTGSYMYFGDVNVPISHNDYLLILSEQGLVGIIIFSILIISFIYSSYKNYKQTNDDLDKGILISIIGISFYLLLINAYDNILLWTLFAFINARKVNCNKYRHV